MSAGAAPGYRSVWLMLALAVVLVAVAPIGGPVPVGAQGCGPAAEGRVAVVVVVDDGGAGTSQRCVDAQPRTDTGYDVLLAAGHSLRIESGFLCAIDGLPATGCGNRPDFAGAYWRYFHAAPRGQWSYSTVGGGGYRMPARCAVEGWRWATSADDAITPRIAPPDVTCEAPPVTSPPDTSPPPIAPPPGQVVPDAGGPAEGGAAPPVGGGAATTSLPAVSGPDTGAATSVPGAAVAGDEPRGASGGDRSAADREELTASDGVSTVTTDDSGPGSAVGLLIAVLVIGGLGAAAWWRARSRSAAARAPAEEFLHEGP